jgi:hypothetical protein
MTRLNLIKRKPKKTSLSSLKKKAWSLFSEVIRRGHADHRGMVKCVSCPSWMHWKESHAAHFIPKSRGLVYYFLEKNVHPGCPKCNLFQKEMHKINYTMFMIEKYGPGIVEELEALSKTPAKFYKSDYEQMIATYKQRLSELEHA